MTKKGSDATFEIVQKLWDVADSTQPIPLSILCAQVVDEMKTAWGVDVNYRIPDVRFGVLRHKWQQANGRKLAMTDTSILKKTWNLEDMSLLKTTLQQHTDAKVLDKWNTSSLSGVLWHDFEHASGAIWVT